MVYTRSKTLPTSIVPELQRAAKRVNLDFNKFTNTDNTCGPEAPLFARLEKKVHPYTSCFGVLLLGTCNWRNSQGMWYCYLS